MKVSCSFISRVSNTQDYFCVCSLGAKKEVVLKHCLNELTFNGTVVCFICAKLKGARLKGARAFLTSLSGSLGLDLGFSMALLASALKLYTRSQ